jgi:hypothetical protein
MYRLLIHNKMNIKNASRWNYVLTFINKCNIKNWKMGQETEQTASSPLRRGSFALDCSAIQEEGEEKGVGVRGGGEDEEEEEGKEEEQEKKKKKIMKISITLTLNR